MNKVAAFQILTQILGKQRDLGFDTLVSRIGITVSEGIYDSSSRLYTVEVSVSWSDSSHRALILRGCTHGNNTFRFSALNEEIVVPNPNVGKRKTKGFG